MDNPEMTAQEYIDLLLLTGLFEEMFLENQPDNVRYIRYIGQQMMQIWTNGDVYVEVKE